MSEELQYVVEYCYQTKKPYFGIKLGMQVMANTFLKNEKVLTKGLIQKLDENESALGLNEVMIDPTSNLSKIYHGAMEINERHWSNWVLNPLLVAKTKLLKPVAFNDVNHIEVIELNEKHPFFLGVLYHPEYISKPNNPHPLFDAFIKSML